MKTENIGASFLLVLFAGMAVLLTDQFLASIVTLTDAGSFLRIAGPLVWVFMIFALIVGAAWVLFD